MTTQRSKKGHRKPKDWHGPGTPFKKENAAGIATRFRPGESGNPGGVSYAISYARQVRERAAKNAEEMLDHLRDLALNGVKEETQLGATIKYLEYAIGKPKQEIDVKDTTPGAEGGQGAALHRFITLVRRAVEERDPGAPASAQTVEATALPPGTGQAQ